MIQGMDRLTLITKNGASITDRSGGNLAGRGYRGLAKRNLQGFTINGGGPGIVCNTASLCYLTGNTIEGPGRFGVNVLGGSRVFLESNVIQNWGRGAFINGSAQVFSSNDVFQGNGGSAIVVLSAAYFESLNSSFNNNGVGIEAGGMAVYSTAVLSVATRRWHETPRQHPAMFGGPTITGNGGVGVHLEDGSFAGFLAANITGNLGGLDIECAPQFPITRFVERTGGITNCVEPPSKSQLKDVE